MNPKPIHAEGADDLLITTEHDLLPPKYVMRDWEVDSWRWSNLRPLDPPEKPPSMEEWLQHYHETGNELFLSLAAIEYLYEEDVPVGIWMFFQWLIGNTFLVSYDVRNYLNKAQMPEELRDHFFQLMAAAGKRYQRRLGDPAMPGQRGRQKLRAQLVRDPYLVEMRDLMHLTGISAERAAHLVAEVVGADAVAAAEYFGFREISNPPTADTVSKWWKQRSRRLREPPICHLTLEEAQARIEPHLVIDGTLKIRPEVLDQ